MTPKRALSSADLDPILARTKDQIRKSVDRLELSYKKAKGLPQQVESLTDDQLEVWEGLLSRFARTVDLFLSKYLRTRVLKEEPGFRGSSRDLLNLAEKLGWIESAAHWLEIKELRNRQAHEYEDTDLEGLFAAVLQEAPFVLSVRKALD